MAQWGISCVSMCVTFGNALAFMAEVPLSDLSLRGLPHLSEMYTERTSETFWIVSPYFDPIIWMIIGVLFVLALYQCARFLTYLQELASLAAESQESDSLEQLELSDLPELQSSESGSEE